MVALEPNAQLLRQDTRVVEAYPLISIPVVEAKVMVFVRVVWVARTPLELKVEVAVPPK